MVWKVLCTVPGRWRTLSSVTVAFISSISINSLLFPKLAFSFSRPQSACLSVVREGTNNRRSSLSGISKIFLIDIRLSLKQESASLYNNNSQHSTQMSSLKPYYTPEHGHNSFHHLPEVTQLVSDSPDKAILSRVYSFDR